MSASSAAGLVQAVETAVSRGELVPGQALPSVRALAAQVSLSPVTVASALAELRRRGVVVTEPRRGSRIGEGPPIGGALGHAPVPEGVRDLSKGNPDPTLLPDLARALSGISLPVRLYGEPAALGELERLAAQRLEADGVPAERLCLVSGALDGIERALAAHLRPGDRVAVEDPGYAALYDLLRAQGLALEGVAVDDCGMLPRSLRRALRAGARAAILTPRGQNPTGAALDAARARELGEVLDAHPDVLAIEDDHLGPVAGVPLHTTMGGRRRWAATRSVAKAFGPDLRLAVLAGDQQTVARVHGRQQCGPGWVSHVLQRLVFELWSDREVERQVARAGALYAARRETLIERLADQGVAAHGSSGLNVWVPVTDESAVVGALAARGWAVAAGARYRLGAGGQAVRVTTATLRGDEAARLAGDFAAVLAPSGSSRFG